MFSRKQLFINLSVVATAINQVVSPFTKVGSSILTGFGIITGMILQPMMERPAKLVETESLQAQQYKAVEKLVTLLNKQAANTKDSPESKETIAKKIAENEREIVKKHFQNIPTNKQYYSLEITSIILLCTGTGINIYSEPNNNFGDYGFIANILGIAVASINRFETTKIMKAQAAAKSSTEKINRDLLQISSAYNQEIPTEFKGITPEDWRSREQLKKLKLQLENQIISLDQEAKQTDLSDNKANVTTGSSKEAVEFHNEVDDPDVTTPLSVSF